MAIVQAEITTPWTKDDENMNVPLVLEKIIRPDGGRWRVTDITGQPSGNILPDPNLYNVLVICDENTLAKIETDAEFYVHWSELYEG